jgi:ABC-type uncharacterized transport system fused permease/ATPase subunit
MKGIRFISVGHRPTILPFHTRVSICWGGDKWTLKQVDDCLATSTTDV